MEFITSALASAPPSGLLTGAIFILTLFLILRKPNNIHEAYATIGGALLMLLCKCVTPTQALKTVADGSDVLVFLFALMLFSSLLDRAGFFEWCALQAARAANGKGLRLYTNVFLVGAIITAFLSLDTTAIILTPVVVSFVQRLKLNALPFVIACAFVSNTGSLLLPVSNLTNLLFQHSFNISFFAFAEHMAIPQVVAVVSNFVLFVLLFKKDLPTSYETDLPEPSSVIENEMFFKISVVALVLVVLGYFVGALFSIPPFVIALMGCVILVIPGIYLKRIGWQILLRDISWELFPFVIGLFVQIRALENLGLTKQLAHFLSLFDHHQFLSLLATTATSAIGCNAVNNVPMALLAISAIREMHTSNLGPQFAALIGCNIGPNLTVTGSLATMLVLTSARKKGVNITPWQFFKVGLLVTPCVVLLTLASLWLSLRIFGGASH